MNSDFSEFKKWFKYYQNKFGLLGWKVYFKHESVNDKFAGISLNLSGMVATVRLNNKLPDEVKPLRDIKRSAKHEALHLLVGRLEANGRERYILDNEMYESIEELVNKLCELIE